jgi:hypothetical protein
MNTLKDAWIWHEKNLKLLRLIGRMGRLYWNDLPWDGDIGKDENFRMLEGVDIHADANAVLSEFDDLAIFVLFSVFEAVVRAHVQSELEEELNGLQHEALKRSAKRLRESIKEGSFYLNVLDLYKGMDAHKVEEVSQVRVYRNWVAHGRRDKRPFAITPKEAYDRLQDFLNIIGYKPPAEPVKF